MGPRLGELNFNKKVRGAKAPNSSPIITREDAEEDDDRRGADPPGCHCKDC